MTKQLQSVKITEKYTLHRSELLSTISIFLSGVRMKFSIGVVQKYLWSAPEKVGGQTHVILSYSILKVRAGSEWNFTVLHCSKFHEDAITHRIDEIFR